MAENCIWIDPDKYTEDEKWDKIRDAVRILMEQDYMCLLQDYGSAGFEIWFYSNDADELGDEYPLVLTADERCWITDTRLEEMEKKEWLNKVDKATKYLDNKKLENILKNIEISLDKDNEMCYNSCEPCEIHGVHEQLKRLEKSDPDGDLIYEGE